MTRRYIVTTFMRSDAWALTLLAEFQHIQLFSSQKSNPHILKMVYTLIMRLTILDLELTD